MPEDLAEEAKGGRCRERAASNQPNAPGMNRTCARGLGTSVRKVYLQGKVRLFPNCAPVNAPVASGPGSAPTEFNLSFEARARALT